ncbi:MAG: hypothetical protein HGB14_08335 [Anaerolineaceae bacterium]|nr:hypothetical protein [Anaerolineaceae bacterium]
MDIKNIKGINVNSNYNKDSLCSLISKVQGGNTLLFVGAGFSKTMINREHAEMLALGGINIAIAELTYDKDEKEKK